MNSKNTWYHKSKDSADIYNAIDSQLDFSELWENMFNNKLKEKYDLTIQELEEILKIHHPEKLI